MSTSEQPRARAAHITARAASTYYVQANTSAHNAGFADYLREISRLPLLASAEERALGEAIKRTGGADTAAVNALVERNLRLVVSVAKFFTGRGVDLDDLIGEGNIGLMRAAGSFDPDRAAFSTHAVWWIRQACARAVGNQGHAIRRPIHVGERLNRVKRAAQAFVQEHGRAPTLDELGTAAGLTYDQLVAALIVPADPLSLNAPSAMDDEREVGETVPDPTAEAAYERVERAVDNAESVNWALDFLTERQRVVLILRLGLDGERRHTLQAAGDKIGVTRERVRQIEAAALKALRIRFKHQDGALVRRTPAEEREQERRERRLMAGRRGAARPGAPSVGNVRYGRNADLWAGVIGQIDTRATVAS